MVFPKKSSLNALLLISGVWGFAAGVLFNSCWQVAVEGAQVVAGTVKYPAGNPFYIYQLKAWTLLHQLPALGLRLGLTEKFLSIALCGVMGILAFQALALSVYIFCQDIWISLIAAFFIYLTRSFSFGVTYPLFLLGTSATYGAIGLTFLFVSVALLGAGRTRSGALMLGISPAIHAALGGMGTVVVFAAAAMEWKRNESIRKNFFSFFAIGIAISLLSYAIQWPLVKNIPSIDPAIAKKYLEMFVRFWDSHRQPVHFFDAGVIINGLAFVLCSIWLRYFREDLTLPASWMMRIYQVATALSIIIGILSWMSPQSLPVWFLMPMPSRLFNFSVLGFSGMLIGLWSVHRKNAAAPGLFILQAMMLLLRNFLRFFIFSSILLIAFRFLKEKKYSAEKFKILLRPLRFIAGLVMAAIVLRMGIFLIRYPRRPATVDWAYWRNDSFYKKVSEGKGLLLLSSDLYMRQLVTRRPVLIDGQALDMVVYALEGAPQMTKILKEVYKTDLFSPPPEAYGMAALPRGTDEEMLNRGVEEWKKVRKEFGVTQILLSSGAVPHLPLVASNADYELYAIPES